jgi:hypothetical protein
LENATAYHSSRAKADLLGLCNFFLVESDQERTYHNSQRFDCVNAAHFRCTESRPKPDWSWSAIPGQPLRSAERPSTFGNGCRHQHADRSLFRLQTERQPCSLFLSNANSKCESHDTRLWSQSKQVLFHGPSARSLHLKRIREFYPSIISRIVAALSSRSRISPEKQESGLSDFSCVLSISKPH